MGDNGSGSDKSGQENPVKIKVTVDEFSKEELNRIKVLNDHFRRISKLDVVLPAFTGVGSVIIIGLVMVFDLINLPGVDGPDGSWLYIGAYYFISYYLGKRFAKTHFSASLGKEVEDLKKLFASDNRYRVTLERILPGLKKDHPLLAKYIQQFLPWNK